MRLVLFWDCQTSKADIPCHLHTIAGARRRRVALMFLCVAVIGDTGADRGIRCLCCLEVAYSSVLHVRVLVSDRLSAAAELMCKLLPEKDKNARNSARDTKHSCWTIVWYHIHPDLNREQTHWGYSDGS